MLNQKDLSELNTGDEVTLLLIVNKCEIKSAKNGKPFLSLELRDKSAVLPAKIWERTDEASRVFVEGTIVKIGGLIEDFNGSPQIKIDKYRVANQSDNATHEDFLPRSRRPIAKMMSEFDDLISSIKNPFLLELVKNIFEGKDLENYKRTPAGKGWHHAYIHGLLEHTLEIARICDLMSLIHPEIDRDLLICGALLHDFGKTEELTYQTGFDYSDKGKFIGHIVIGALAIERGISSIPNFPIELKHHLLHLVLSHQGKLEFASPVEPKTLEAIVLYQADELSAKTNAYKSAIEAEANKGGNWTKFLPLANTSLYIPDDFKKKS